jgi:CheY-like chemotaxis protein/lipopolysaccharide biosynthesis regulator YciM
LAFKIGILENRTYLVVDDFGDMRSMIKNMLMASGVKQVSLAINGAQAIERIAEKRFDVVLCDYNLGPGKDGQQVLEEAKHRQLIGLDCVFVMITAENTRDMVMGAVEYEPDSYLTKPFNKDLLKKRLEKLIAKKQDLLPVEQAVAKRDHSLALRLLDEKIAAKPANSNELKKIKGEICFSAGMIDKARQVYEEVISVRDLPWARLGLGKILFQEKAYSEAQAQFQDLTEQHPNYTAAYDWLAKCYKSQNQLAEAQQTLQAAAEISPKAVLRQQMLGEVALLNKDEQAAEVAFTKAVKHGRHSVYKHPSNYANLAKVCGKTKNGDAGFKVLRDMKREFHKEPKADLYMATAESAIHEAMGNQQAAKASLERAAEIYQNLDKNTSSDCSIELAKSYKTLDMEEKSVELLKSVVLNNHTDDSLMDEIKQTVASMDIKEDALGSIDALRDEVASLNKKGVELAKTGKLAEAISLLKQTSERMPANRVVNLNTALVLLMDMERDNFSVSKADEINIYLERVAKAEPNNPTLNKLQYRLKSMIKAAVQED